MSHLKAAAFVAGSVNGTFTLTVKVGYQAITVSYDPQSAEERTVLERAMMQLTPIEVIYDGQRVVSVVVP